MGHHVINRGNYQRPLFAPDGAAESFFNCPDEACTNEAPPVEPGHALAQVAHYAQLNPVRAKIVPPERVGDYP